jgi:hypothetical protein
METLCAERPTDAHGCRSQLASGGAGELQLSWMMGVRRSQKNKDTLPGESRVS